MRKHIRAHGLPTVASIVLHACAFGVLLLLAAWLVRAGAPQAARLATGIVHRAPLPEEQVPTASAEVEDLTDEVQQQEVVAREPNLQDAALLDVDESDGDLPNVEAYGETEGVSDAPFEGPQQNNLLGTGGAAGGTFAGRGGALRRSHGGGGTRGSDDPHRKLGPSTLAAHRVRLKVGETETLPLRRTRVDVRVSGFRARVTLDWTFANERDRTLEGSFQVRLPDGAVPVVLAFGPVPPSVARAAVMAAARDNPEGPSTRLSDDTASLRFARFAPRARAARAYRETSRPRPTPVDPALLEWSAAGVFDARVFPLTARQEHRVRFAYDIPLTPVDDELVLRLDFPPGPSPFDLDLAFESTRGRVTPEAPFGPGRHRWRDPDVRTFTVAVPRCGLPTLVGGAPDVGPVFASLVRPAVPPAPPRVSARAVFLFDTSGSAQGPRRALQWELLAAILERSRPHLAEFQVAFFDLEVSWWRNIFTPNTPENVAALRAALDAAPSGAATDLGAALGEAGGRGGDYDVFLLSDGAATWGERDPRALTANTSRAHPLFAYALNTGGTDLALLERLARHTGGAVVPVVGPEAVAGAAVAHTARPWRIVSASVEGSSDVLLAGRPLTLFPGQTLTVVGRGAPAPGAALVLDLERDGIERRVTTGLGAPQVSDLALGCYGGVAVAHLEQTSETFQDLARAYALHFGVVCSAVSLVMLDTDDAYGRFGIDSRADALAVKSSEPGRLAARAASEPEAGPDPRAALARWLAIDDGPSVRPPNRFQELLALLPETSLRPPSRGSAAAALARTLGGPPGQARLGPDARPDRVFAVAEELAQGGAALAALRTVSSLVERSPGDAALLRAVAYRALAWGRPDAAFGLFLRTLDAPPNPLPALVGMGAALAEAGAVDLALLAYEAALAQGTARPDPLSIARGEYLALLRRVSGKAAEGRLRTFAEERVATLASEAGSLDEADLVVTIAWSTDHTDVDLHVQDPRGEVCNYTHRLTAQGGRISADETRGLGPERFVLEQAAAGDYTVRVHGFRSDERRASLTSHVLVTIVEDWGRPSQRVTRRVLDLESGAREQTVATVHRAR